MARQLIQAGRAAGDNSLPGIDSMCHNIRQWERGQRALTERYRLLYCKALGTPPPSSVPRQPAPTPGPSHRPPPPFRYSQP